MKILLSWIHEMLPTQPTADEVKNALLSVGIEVGFAQNLGEGLEDVVVAKILERGKHPDADRLSLCKVTDGTAQYSIVCGATNMKAGDLVAMARIGAKLPNAVVLKKSKIRGVESEGMLCSESELKFSEESDGILILPADAPIGTKLADYLKRNDWVLELELTPNRGDCLGVVGIVREVAAALNLSPKISVMGGEGPREGEPSAFVDDTAGAPRYVLRYLNEIKVGPSPSWMTTRLQASGVRSINNVVDTTNYVMLEWGQPMHAFDREKVKGKVHVRRARSGETIVCLDDLERRLEPEDLVIADDEGPIAIAGVMGGKRTAVSVGTKSILLESAYFDPRSVRTTAKRMNLHTESSHRFERGVDPGATWTASTRALELFTKVAGAKEVSSVDLRQPLATKKLTLRRSTLERILGEDVKEAGTYLSRLGLPTEKLDTGWLVEVPPRRSDLTREIDLVEEVARLHGFGKFPSTIPPVTVEPSAEPTYEGLERVRTILASAGFKEIRTYSFSSKEELDLFAPSAAPIPVLNPIAAGAEYMRGSLVPAVLNVWKFNQARQRESLEAFEVGVTYTKAPQGHPTPALEDLRATCVMAGTIQPKTWSEAERSADFFDGRGIVEHLFEKLQLSGLVIEASTDVEWMHPGKSAKIVWRKKDLGVIGELHPRVLRRMDLKGPVVVVDLSLSPVLAAVEGVVRYKPASSFPIVRRDLAFLVKKEVSAEKFFADIKKLRDPLVQETELFDHYDGKGVPEGQVSLAFRLTFGSNDHTLKDEEVEASLRKIVAQLQMTCGAALRGELIRGTHD